MSPSPSTSHILGLNAASSSPNRYVAVNIALPLFINNALLSEPLKERPAL